MSCEDLSAAIIKERDIFIISLHYKGGLDAVEKHLDAHVAYLKEEYAKGNCIASGRKISRTWGVIL